MSGAAGRRLMGAEREYAFAFLGTRGFKARRSAGVPELLREIKRGVTWLRDVESTGIYTAGGGRFYIDTGNHIEHSTAEAVTPFDVVRTILAGERVLAGAAERLNARSDLAGRAVLSRVAVDYGGSRSTWGAHESYAHRTDPSIIWEQLIPFLASRDIVCGAGGLVPNEHEFRFALSPRAFHIELPVSSGSTGVRGLVHAKDEPLAKGDWHRLHLICGGALRLERGEVLKFGTTALVVAMAEAGMTPASDVQLKAPVPALYSFCLDPWCRHKEATEGGRQVSALDIQRHYLEAAEARIGEPYMPSWTERICALWRETLDLVERGPEAVATVLDWGVKYALYTEYLSQRDLSWDALRSLRYVMNNRPPLPNAERLDPTRVREILGYRAQLHEMEFRFGQLGEEGVFEQLDRQGVLDHEVPEVDRVDEAITKAPEGSRAALRGKWISLLAEQSPDSICHWASIYEPHAGKILRMSDPFTREATWERTAKLAPGSSRHLQQMLGSC